MRSIEELMMAMIDAIYRNGVFEPLEPVKLPEGERVKVQVPSTFKLRQPAPDWFVRLRAHTDEMRAKFGVLPESTHLIREDRERDI